MRGTTMLSSGLNFAQNAISLDHSASPLLCNEKLFCRWHASLEQGSSKSHSIACGVSFEGSKSQCLQWIEIFL